MVEYSFSDLLVAKIEFDGTCRAFLDKFHYAGSGRNAKACYISKHDKHIVTIAKLTSVVRLEVATTLGFSVDQVLELDRLCANPDFQKKNLMSWFLSRVLQKVRHDFPNISCLVSFADTGQGHIGTIYKASNWKAVSVTKPSYVYLDIDGNIINKKTLYNWACRDGMTEKEKAQKMGLTKHKTEPKIKYVYYL